MMRGPLRVEVTRGGVVERRHDVVAVALDARHRVVVAYGDTSLVTPTRSTVKLLQALPLVRGGAADAFELSDAELALACASHSGEADHRQRVERWLSRLGHDEHALQCPCALPWMADRAARFLRDGGTATRLAHNCSGKHTGYLTLALHLGTDPSRYLDPTDALQTFVLDSVADACEVRRSDMAVGLDGCGAPVPCLSIEAIACGLTNALVADATGASAERRLFDAWTRHPELVAGPGRIDTDVAVATDGSVLSKLGADGVHVAYVRSLGVGVVVKAVDGDRLAAELALLHVLRDLDPAQLPSSIDEQRERVLRNDNGTVTGVARIAG